MENKLFDRLKEGLEEAVRFSNGEDTGATIYTPINLKEIRKKQNLSQSKFADEFGLNLNTLKNWEQGTRSMDTATIILFKTIEQYPEIVKKVVKSL